MSQMLLIWLQCRGAVLRSNLIDLLQMKKKKGKNEKSMKLLLLRSLLQCFRFYCIFTWHFPTGFGHNVTNHPVRVSQSRCQTVVTNATLYPNLATDSHMSTLFFFDRQCHTVSPVASIFNQSRINRLTNALASNRIWSVISLRNLKINPIPPRDSIKWWDGEESTVIERPITIAWARANVNATGMDRP